MTELPLVLSTGWASGLDAWGTALLLGLLGRFDHSADVPPTLERTDVLVVMGLLFLLQFVADKIPIVDSIWDVIHTPIRPIMAGAIGVLMANNGHGSLAAAVAAAVVGGGTALVSHTAKAGIRMGVNTSPEPFSNIAVSFLEHGLVAGIVAFALVHPVAAAVLSGVLLVVMLTLMAMVAKRIKSFRRRRRERREARAAARAGSPSPV